MKGKLRVDFTLKMPHLGPLACDILLAMNPTEYLSRAERIQQIGELLAKGATLMLIRKAEARRTQLTPNGPMEQAAHRLRIPDDHVKPQE